MERKTSVGEFYTEGESENFDKLNEIERDKFFQDIQFNDNNNVISDSTFKEDMGKMLKPDFYITSDYYSTEDEYIPKTTDPYKRILELKKKLLSSKLDIDNAVEKFNKFIYINDIENFSSLYDYVTDYKNKIDAFIDYDTFNEVTRSDYESISSSSESGSESKEASDEDEEEENSKSESASSNKEKEKEKEDEKEKKEKKKKDKKKVESIASKKKKEKEEKKKKINSTFDRNKRISNNLLTRLKMINSDLSQSENKVKYKIEMNPENELDIVSARLLDLESTLNKLEKKIGNWDIIKFHESISMTVNGLKDFVLSKASERYESRHQIFKNLSNLLNDFISKNKKEINIANTFFKIKEIYSVYETMLNFSSVIKYMRDRLDIIKKVNYSSEHINSSLRELIEISKRNEEGVKSLEEKFQETLDSFKEIENLLERMNAFEEKIRGL